MKKTISIIMLVVLVSAVSVLGTLAYLTAQSEVTNTFTVGKVTLGDGSVGSGLDEAKVNQNGQPIDDNNNVVSLVEAPRVTTNTYKLLPGHTYTKDPTIHVGSDSDDCFLFVKVVNGLDGVEDTDNGIQTQMQANGWYVLAEINGLANNEHVFVYSTSQTDEGKCLPATVSAGSNKIVFSQFKIKDDATSATLDAYKNATITVTAYAVQADGFEGKTAMEVWTAAFGN